VADKGLQHEIKARGKHITRKLVNAQPPSFPDPYHTDAPNITSSLFESHMLAFFPALPPRPTRTES